MMLVSGCGAGSPRRSCWELAVGQETTQRGCCGSGLGSSCRSGVSEVRGLGSRHCGVATGRSHRDVAPMVWLLWSSCKG